MHHHTSRPALSGPPFRLLHRAFAATFHCLRLAPVFVLVLATTTSWAVNPPVFGTPRGFYADPFSLTLAVDPADVANANLRVRYTLDGKLPTPTVGQDYTAPISVTSTTTVRAIVYDSANPATVSVSVGASYLFLAHVIHQPVNIPTAADPNFANWPAYPRETYDVGNNRTAVHDYEMDPDVVNNPAYNALSIPALQAIPTLSLIADEAEMFGPNGFYDGETEHAGSLEILNPGNAGADQQLNCGIDPHSSNRLKRSLRLEFSSAFGPSKLTSGILQTAPVGAGQVTGKFDNLILRAGNNRSWARIWNPDATTYTEDEWFRETQAAMSGVGAHGTFVHLYINGLYWGLYNLTERPDESFASTYTGGKKGDHFSLKEDGRTKGDATRWNYLTTTLLAKDLTVPANYTEMKSYLDVNYFSDYLILAFYTGWNDWPHNNWWVDIRNDVPLPARYYAWDGEWSWDRGNPYDPSINGEVPNGAWVHPAFRNGSTDNSFQAQFWRALKVNPDFLTTFADRVYLHTANGGALTDQNVRRRWNALNLYVEDAIIAESARWGDAITPTAPRTRDIDWNREVSALYGLMGGNATRLISALRAQGVYPLIDPPHFSHAAGSVAQGLSVTLSNPNSAGTIYYKTDGTDPRLSGGGLDPAATAYAGPLTINAVTDLRARVLNGTQWSALAAGIFTPTTTNGAPVVTAVAPITDTLPAGIAVSATAVDDGLPSGTLTTQWTQVSGPGTATFANPAALATTATFSAAGSYVLRFTASDGDLQSSNDVPVFVYAAGTNVQQRVESFTLINADTGAPIAGFETLFDGMAIDLGTLPTRHLNIRANTSPLTVGSVRFAFAGKTNFRTESGAPYALFGDANGVYNPWTPAVGSYTLKATPYTGANAAGTAGVALTVGFTVTDSSVADTTPPSVPTSLSADTFTTTSFTLHWAASTDDVGVTGYEVLRDGASQGVVGTTSLNLTGLSPNTTYAMTVRARDASGNWSAQSSPLNVTTPAGSGTAVTGFTLIDADADVPIAGLDPIPNGAVIQRASLPTTHLNVRVNTNPAAVGSVRVKLDNGTPRVESGAPYALFGDNNGNYNAGTIANGSHTLTATPYSAANATGTAGTPLTITFTIQ
jgi:hypothetical protein